MKNIKNIEKIIRTLVCFIFFSIIYPQIENPVSLSYLKSEPVRAGEVFDIKLKAEMESNWRIYSVHKTSEGPIPTEITINGDFLDAVGDIIEPEPEHKWDEGFGVKSYFHKDGSIFKIPVKLKASLAEGSYSALVDFRYIVCDDRMCYPPNTISLIVPISVEMGSPRSERTNLIAADEDEINIDKTIQEGFLSFFLLSLSMGFLALLTPCVFPMIPITVSFFTKKGEEKDASPIKQASVYALGIIAIFSILGISLAVLIGASGANQLASSPWVNLFIGFLFVYFALSLFGMYEIQLPTSLQNFTLRKEKEASGYLGTLFMSATFTLASFTCTVQFVGLLLVAASQGQWFWPIVGMIVFSGAFATPFFFLALFPQYLSKIPKSGGWLNSIKVVMGFMELAAAFKFFSNTDLVWRWGIFTYTSVLVLWTMIFLFTGFYLLGKIKLPHDTRLESIGVPRMLFSLIFLSFGLYLGTGLLGRNIHGLIESYLPPIIHSDTKTVDMVSESEITDHKWYTELDDALLAAQAEDKPIFIDFTGYTCTNCRWMETNIFTIDEVKKRFEKYILLALYTDGGNNYREKQQYEIDRFGTAALPFYVLLTKDDQEIATFPGMTRDVQKFINFLDKGLNL